MTDEPPQERSRDEVAIGILRHRRVREREIRQRVDEQLVTERRPALPGRPLRDHGGERAAHAVAANRQPARIQSELAAVAGEPRRDRPAVVDRRREAVLRRPPVVDGHDRRAAPVRQLAARPVGSVEVADHPAAGVEPGDRRQRGRFLGRSIDANHDIARRPRDPAVLDGDHRLGLSVEERQHPADGAALVDRDLVDRLLAAGGHPLEKRLHLRIQRHWPPPPARRLTYR